MKVELEQIKAITSGAVEVIQVPDGIEFYRFTAQQRECYMQKKEHYGFKSMASTGIRLDFKTDSKKLNLEMTVKNCRARSFFTLEVFVDGVRIGMIDNYSNQQIPQFYSSMACPVGEFAGAFDLGDGEKTVTVYLPWNKRTLLRSFCLDDGAYVAPVRRDKKMLVFGDSITMGYDALCPSRRHIGRVADFLNAEEINKAIGGERFCPDLLEWIDDVIPDYIWVAYGTNDWSGWPWEKFNARVTEFFERLTEKFPDVPTFVVTPIWRSNYQTERSGYQSFFDIEQGIRRAVADKKNIILIPGFDMIPHDEVYYADQVLHPNDSGFDHYFDNLKKYLKKYI